MEDKKLENSNACVSCGLCCVYYPTINPTNWAWVMTDEEQVPKKLYQIDRNPSNREHYNKQGFKAVMKTKKDSDWKDFRRCVALEGEVRTKVSCKVYENRPRVCSDYEVGSERCNKIREWGGLEPLETKVNLVLLEDYYEK